MWIQRTFEHTWRPESGQPVSVLLGPRQSGKSSFLERRAGPSRRAVSFDDLSTRARASENPALFLDELGPEVLIDEAQYVPELFPELKIRVDAVKRRTRAGSPGPSFSAWLTGSNRLVLDREVAESLTGRASYFRFHGLSVAELAASLGKPTLADLFSLGGFPELWTSRQLDPVRYLNDHLQTALERDLVRAARIEKVPEFLRVLRLLASRVGGLFVASELGRDAGIRSSTVTDWVGAVERMMYLIEVPAFTTSRTTRLIKAAKYYFFDTALAARLQGWSQPEPLLNSPAVGPLFENLVVAEVAKTRDAHQRSWELSHFRTKEKEEVDLLVSDGTRLVAIECKLSSRRAAEVTPPRSLSLLGPLPFLAVCFDAPPSARGQVEVVQLSKLGPRLLELLSG